MVERYARKLAPLTTAVRQEDMKQPIRFALVMWRYILPLILMLLPGGRLYAQGQQSVDALLDVVASPRSIPYAERQAAKDALIARSYNEVLPKLAVRITQAPPEWSSRMRMSGTGIGLGDEKSLPGEQAIWALEQIWQAHTYGSKSPTFARDLIRYLGDGAFRGLRYRLVEEISIYWCAESEEPITKLFADDKQPASLRYRAAYALMRHARDKNMDAMLDFVQAHPGGEAAFFIRDLMTALFPRFNGSPTDFRLLMMAQDQMEQEVREASRISGGYFTALAMGAFIATRVAPPNARDLPNPFEAGQDDPGMRRPDGNLSQAFFEVPVIRAREWWKKHGESIRRGMTQPAG